MVVNHLGYIKHKKSKNTFISFQEIIKRYMYNGDIISPPSCYYNTSNVSNIYLIATEFILEFISLPKIDWNKEIKYWNSEKKEAKLLEAATKNNYDLAHKLLFTGVDINIVDKGGNTPLHRAAWKGHLRIVKLLVEHKAAISKGTNMGNSPLHRAAYNGRINVIRYLLDNNANIDIECNYGHTPVFAAAHYGQIRELKYLICKSANLSHKNELGQSILHIVAHKCMKNNESIIKLLLDEKKSLIESVDNQGYSPIHSACYFGSLENTITLCNFGANDESLGNAGFTPLLSAILGIQPEIVEYLLNNGSYYDIISVGPETILDVLERAKTEGVNDNGSSIKNWEKSNQLISTWLNSNYEELFLQKLFQGLFNIPSKSTYFREFSGWLKSDTINLPIETILHTLLTIFNDVDYITKKYNY